MKLIDYIVYKEVVSEKIFVSIEEIEKLMDGNKYNNNYLNYYFELHEADDIVIFANLTGYELDEEDIKTGLGRIYQIETAVLVKNEMKVYHIGDNDIKEEYIKLLINKPVWTKESFEQAGIALSGLTDAYNDEAWQFYV